MHTCQIMLVEADSAEQALSYVRSTITNSEETPYPDWSDWHGGLDDGLAGRWSGLFLGWEENRDVLCYTENKVLAEDIIKEFVAYRIDEAKNLLDKIKKENGFNVEKAVSEYSPYKQKFDDSGMDMWRLQRIAKILNNDWCSDTGVYDLQEHTANLEYFKERLDKNPEKQYLVPIDFHH